jgi:carbon monoxide dehydrogenase subunit G
MTTIESKHVEVAASPSRVKEYASNLDNFKKLLPQDKISDFVSNGESCSFKIKGMATIGLKVMAVQDKMIQLESTDSPFSFTIDVHLDEKSAEVTEAYQIVKLDLNPMMKMMVERPLRNLFDHIADRLHKELG